jgi:hypothetical protein
MQNWGRVDSGPPWPRFPVAKHAPAASPMSGLYCLAATARWLHRFDSSKKPTIQGILRGMTAAIPPNVAATGLAEKHLRKAASVCGLHIYRPNIDSLLKIDWPPDWIWIAAVQGLPVPRLREPPQDRRCVLVLGLPDAKGRFLIADPHPDVPAQYAVPVEKFAEAWEAGATKTHRPWAASVQKA